jgi:hypothetical protein
LLLRCLCLRSYIRQYINERVVKVDTVLPPNIQYCTYNRDRDSINTGLFDDYCKEQVDSL